MAGISSLDGDIGRFPQDFRVLDFRVLDFRVLDFRVEASVHPDTDLSRSR
jgi:hypothetical protein